MTPRQLKYEVEAASHERHFFDRQTMKFFGDTMSNYGARSTVITCNYKMNPFPSGSYIGTYKGVPFYSDRGEYQCLFGWVPKRFHSIRQLKINVTKWRKS